ncbi:CLUMA_CG016972, isoform A [Clunio marinus]|uniref:CLUMA_CG016972, isoform A n=1 Tax=Clunio marinus TaxID=568069 RepID=A0A1J1IS47_9DIPT|nr:CLUMA_CG016972, isoform A [Clunio marinus]
MTLKIQLIHRRDGGLKRYLLSTRFYFNLKHLRIKSEIVNWKRPASSYRQNQHKVVNYKIELLIEMLNAAASVKCHKLLKHFLSSKCDWMDPS